MSEQAKASFETLKSAESGRRLVSQTGRHEVAAKILTDADGDEYLVLRTWVASPPGLHASAEWSEPSIWSHVVFDDDLNLVATGWGMRERDSWAMVQKALTVKGIDSGSARQGRIPHVNPDYEAVGVPTLRAWLEYWTGVHAGTRSLTPGSNDTVEMAPAEIAKLRKEIQERGYAADSSVAPSKFVWEEGDFEVLSREESEAILGRPQAHNIHDEDGLPRGDVSSNPQEGQEGS